MMPRHSRRALLATAVGLARPAAAAPAVIDIHQHTPYSGRTAEQLVAHQRTMGVARTILLPAGRKYGLAAGAGGNDEVVALARRHPEQFSFFANELPDQPDTRAVLEKYLKLGAIGIGEQKFPVEADSKHVDLVASIAREFRVPVLLHFQHETYNLGYESFYKVLQRHPQVNFIGHAQTFWGYIDKSHDPKVLYPKGPVAEGGLTARFLRDYANFYADLSAGSGLNAFTRDEEHARAFLQRHQDKLLYGSDCNDAAGQGEACSGSRQLALVRRLASEAVAAKILEGNARRLLRL